MIRLTAAIVCLFAISTFATAANPTITLDSISAKAGTNGGNQVNGSMTIKGDANAEYDLYVVCAKGPVGNIKLSQSLVKLDANGDKTPMITVDPAGLDAATNYNAQALLYKKNDDPMTSVPVAMSAVKKFKTP
jgi:hypothetical protein